MVLTEKWVDLKSFTILFFNFKVWFELKKMALSPFYTRNILPKMYLIVIPILKITRARLSL